MPSFEVRWRKSALDDIKRIGKTDRDAFRRLMQDIDALTQTPFPRNSRKLTGSAAYRLRVGAFRVFYTLDGEARVVVVEEISARSRAYRNR